MAERLSANPPRTAREWLELPHLVEIAGIVARRFRCPAADLDDLVQELRIAVWNEGPDTLLHVAWLYRVAANRSLDMLKAASRACSETSRGAVALGPVPDPELAALFRARASLLPTAMRPAFELGLEGLSERQIAERLQVSRGRVRRINEWCDRFLRGRPGEIRRSLPLKVKSPTKLAS